MNAEEQRLVDSLRIQISLALNGKELVGYPGSELITTATHNSLEVRVKAPAISKKHNVKFYIRIK